VNGSDNGWGDARILEHLAAALGDAKTGAKQGLSGGRAQAHHHARLDFSQLGLEPRSTGTYLARIGLAVDPPLAARLPLEVLDHVGDVDLRPIDADFRQRLVEDSSGRPDKRVAGAILVVARLFADEHDPGSLGASPKTVWVPVW